MFINYRYNQNYQHSKPVCETHLANIRTEISRTDKRKYSNISLQWKKDTNSRQSADEKQKTLVTKSLQDF